MRDSSTKQSHIESRLDKIERQLQEEAINRNSQFVYTKEQFSELKINWLSLAERALLIEKTVKQFDMAKGAWPSLTERMASDDITVSDIISKINEIHRALERFASLGFDIFKPEQFKVFDKHTTSQAGEDSIIAYMVAHLGIPYSECDYLELGSNHHKEMNNTWFFYSQGAKGVLVEANPSLLQELKLYRYRDVVVNKCVTDESGEFVDFYVLNFDGLSTPIKEEVDVLLKENDQLELKQVVSVETTTVNQLFENYFVKAPVILSIDIEGKDFEILQSVDFNKWRPVFVICEMIPYSKKLVVGMKNKEIFDLMTRNNYTEFAFTGINSIFIANERIPI